MSSTLTLDAQPRTVAVVSWKTPIILAVMTVLFALLPLLVPRPGDATFRLSGGGELFALPNLVVPGTATAWIAVAIAAALTAVAFVLSARRIRVPMWLTAVYIIALVFGFLAWAAAGSSGTLPVVGLLGGALALATPLIFLLMAVGLWRGTKLVKGGEGGGRPMLAVLVWVGLGYFIAHSLHDRVQGNWPCFLFPALAILAADGFGQTGIWRKVSVLAAPVALVLLLAVYLQALFAFLPLKKDPLARILGREFAPIGEVVAALVRTHLADAVLTTDYETTAWLRFNHPDIKVVQVNEPQRYPQAPAADAALLKRPLIYLAEFRRDQHPLVQRLFAYTGFPTQLQTPSSLYMVYPVSRPKSSPIGKMP